MDNSNAGTYATFAIVLAVSATTLGIVTAGDTVIATDVSIAAWIQQWQGRLPERLEHLGDMSGETITAIAAVIGGAAMAAFVRSWRIVAFFAVVGILRVVATVLKPYFESPRPHSNRIRIHEYADGFGYPSGHSMTAAMIATVIVILAWNTPGTKSFRWVTAALAAALALMVGWSRVWSGAHWPTDVIGGWSYGVGLVLLAWAITTTLARSRSGQRWLR